MIKLPYFQPIIILIVNLIPPHLTINQFSLPQTKFVIILLIIRKVHQSGFNLIN